MTIEYLDSKRLSGLTADRTGGSITLDAEANNHASASATSITISGFTVGDNSNKILIVSVGSYNLSPTVSGITWNSSESFTQIDTVLNGGRADLWYLVNPTSTTSDIVVTYSSSASSRSAGVTSLYNVNQSTPIGVTNTATGTGGTIAGTITPTTTGSWIIDSAMSLTGLGAITDTLTAGFSNLIGGVDRSHGTQYSASPTINSANAMTWTNGQSSYSWLGAEIKKAEGNLTNLQDNSLLVEKDTARRYWFDANPLLDDNFSTDNWTDSGANVSISSGVMNFDIDRTTTDQSSYYQLSRALSDTKWTMRLHDVIVTTKSGGVEVFIGVSSNTSGAQTAQDFIGLNLGDNTANPVLGGVDSDGAVIARLAGDYTYSLSTTYNIEIIRESATSYRIKVFSNSGFDSTALFSQSYTCTATTTGLQYVKFANGQVAGSTENIIGTCSKMEIFDGVTTASGGGQWTMQPTFEDDFSTNKGWVENSGNSSVNTTTGKLDFNLSAVSGSDNGIVYDLGAGNVSDKFILRCKLHITTSVNNNNHRCWIGIGNSDQSIDESANQYFVGASLYDQAGSNGLNSNLANNTDLQTTFSSSSVYTWSDNTDQWLEITKTETNIICKIYSDSTYVTVSASADLSTAFTGSGTLRYIKLVNRGDVSGGTFTGTIDDIEFYNGVTSIN